MKFALAQTSAPPLRTRRGCTASVLRCFRDGGRSCRVPKLQESLLPSSSSPSSSLAFSLFTVLQPFARFRFRGTFPLATMASADFPSPLGDRLSPGQCGFFPFIPPSSTECVLMTFGLHARSLSRPRIWPRCSFVFLRSNVYFRPFRAQPLRTEPGLRLRLASSPPSGTFHPDRTGTCRAHERGHSCPPGGPRTWY
jgi:hypothetical protein